MFNGSTLASGAVLPMNRVPFFASTSNTARNVVVLKRRAKQGLHPFYRNASSRRLQLGLFDIPGAAYKVQSFAVCAPYRWGLYCSRTDLPFSAPAGKSGHKDFVRPEFCRDIGNPLSVWGHTAFGMLELGTWKKRYWLPIVGHWY